jgi:hypothetical protein
MKASNPALICILIFFILTALLYGRVIIVGDGVSYYAMTLSLLRDHDFDLQNQKREIPNVMAPVNAVTGKPAPMYSCGFALLYLPSLYVADFAASHIPAFASLQPYSQNSRFPFPHAAGIFLASCLIGLFTLLASYYFLTVRNSFSPWLAALIVILVFAGTPLMFYTFVMASYSHAADSFLAAAIFCLIFFQRKFTVWKIEFRNILLGFLLGLSVLLRNNNIALIPPAVGGLLFMERADGWKRAAMTLFEIFLGALPVIAVQIEFNLSQYGKVLAVGYRVQTESGFLFEMLFHPWAGMFVWSPITILALAGLVVGAIQKRSEGVIALLAVISVMVTVQFQPNWWGGCSFGQRFMTHLYFFWVIGLYELHRAIRGYWVILALPCALWMFFLLNVFLINANYTESREMLSQNKCRHSPAALIRSANREYARSQTGIVAFWLDSISTGPFPTLQAIIRK